MANTHEDFDNANRWQKVNDNKKDNHSNKKDYDAEFLNNKKADAVLRAERMTDKELLDAYEKNEKEYVASKEKPPVVDQKKQSLPLEAFRKLINWVIQKLNELAEITKATLLRVAIGKDGVSKVIDNTRKDEEKAERQQKLEREISELDKNAIREELKRRGIGKDSPENENNGKSQEAPKQDSPKKEPSKQKKEAEDVLGKSDKTRLDRLYLGSNVWCDEKYKEDFARFKAEYEAYIKDYTGLTVDISGRRTNQDWVPTRQGALCVKIIDERLGPCSIEYRGNGHVEQFGNYRTEELTEELKRLTSQYINNYDKDSQKSRTASGIYPSRASVKSLVEDMKSKLKEGNETIEVTFFGKKLECRIKGEHAYLTMVDSHRTTAGPKDIILSTDTIYKAIKDSIDKEIVPCDTKDFKAIVEDAIKECEAEQTKGVNEPTKKDEPAKTDPEVSTSKDDKKPKGDVNKENPEDKGKTDIEPEISPESTNDDSIGKQDPDVGDSVTPEPIDHTLENTHENGNESSNFSVIANFGGEDISAFTPLEDFGKQVFGDDDVDQMFNFDNELDDSTKNIPDGKNDIEEEEEIGA